MSAAVARRRTLRTLALVLALALVFGDPGRVAHAEWQSYQAAAGGLADNRINSISEAPDGAIWFGTLLGASRFDGARWSTVLDSLPDSRVLDVLHDRRGRTWFATQQGGLARFDGTSWTRIGVAGGWLPDLEVLALLEDHRGDVWIGTARGLVRYEPAVERWTTYTTATSGLTNDETWRLLEDRQGRLWVATPSGVAELDASRQIWTPYRQDPSALGRDSVLALAEDAQGRIWFGTDQGAWSFGADGWRHWTAADGLSGSLVTCMARDSLGRLWLGGLNGVARTDGRTFRADTRTSDGKSIGSVQRLFVDSSGNLWLGGFTYSYYGTTSQGVFRYDGVGWHNYFAAGASLCASVPSPNIPFTNLLSDNCLSAALQDTRGDLWFATVYGGVNRLDRHGVWSTVRRSAAVPLSDSLDSIVEGPAGTLWFGSLLAGLAWVDSTRTTWTLESQATGLVASDVRTLFVDSRGEVWVGTGSGASRRAPGGWIGFLTGASAAEVQAFAEDGSRRLWLQASAGLFSIDSTRSVVRAWTSADGLADDIVTAMHAASDGSVWFGTGSGVSRLANGTFTTWRGFGVPGDAAVLALGEDPQGGIWAGTNTDAARWDGAAWRTFTVADLGAAPVNGFFFDSAGLAWLSTIDAEAHWNGRSWHAIDNRGNGLATNQINSVLEDSQHRIWFAGSGGLAEHEPDRVAPQTIFVNTPPALSGSRGASFVYGAAYGEVADLEYSYSWDGSPYSTWSSDNTFNASGVADGTHTFFVHARDWAGNVDPTPARFTFQVDATPPAAILSFPLFDQPVRGRVAVTGTTADPRFHDFTVKVRPAGGLPWTDPSTRTLAASAAPVTSGVLATWDTTTLPDGNWELQLAVTDTLGLYNANTITVIVDNVAPFANVTSPVTLHAREGGDVFTTNAEVHVYFPPNAFDADPKVMVDSLAAGARPDTLAGGEIRHSAAWKIHWAGANLAKPGVIEMRPAAPGAGLAIWRDPGSGVWSRLGGTIEPDGRLTITLPDSGAYAVFAGGTPPTSRGGLSGLALTPRAFSPRGDFASRDVAIGFSLARSGSVTVKLYNRAGRLVRTVARGLGAGPGANLVHWDGRDDDGHVVNPGLYFVTVEALGETRTQTVAVVP